MKALVFGSLNIDKVYSLDSLPDKGVTLRCNSYEIHVGGKGLNQAIALKKAGFDTAIAGAVGTDGDFLTEYLQKCGIKTDLIMQTGGYTGHAVIEVDKNGQNQMILYPGANGEITRDYCDRILEGYGKGDLILMQYETSCVEYMIEKAHNKGLTVAVNPSPYTDALKNLPYDMIDILVLNEDEGKSITALSSPREITLALLKIMNNGKVILTLGGDGAVYADRDSYISVPAFRVKAGDTTGAGDTFTGYFLEAFLKGTAAKTALTRASAASALVVQKKGAAETIPSPDAVDEFLNSTNAPWAVFIDIDGTLMDENCLISEKNRETIEKARKMGHKVFINTGRAYGNIPEKMLSQFGIFDGIIAGSGSYIELNGKVFSHRTPEKKLVRETVEYILAHKNLWCVLECHEAIIGINGFPENWGIKNIITDINELVDRFSDFSVEVIAVGEKPDEEFRTKFSDRLNIIQLDGFADCISRGCSKSTGMIQVLEHYGIPVSRSIAIGDSNNDLEMLSSAGIAVAVGNACENVLKAADIITAANTENGVAAALEELLFK